jgi:hypothetical protein
MPQCHSPKVFARHIPTAFWISLFEQFLPVTTLNSPYGERCHKVKLPT